MSDFTLKIDGMHCASCVRRASQALAATPGIVVNEITVGTAKLTLSEQSAPADNAIDLAIAALAKVGYSAQLES